MIGHSSDRVPAQCRIGCGSRVPNQEGTRSAGPTANPRATIVPALGFRPAEPIQDRQVRRPGARSAVRIRSFTVLMNFGRAPEWVRPSAPETPTSDAAGQSDRRILSPSSRTCAAVRSERKSERECRRASGRSADRQIGGSRAATDSAAGPSVEGIGGRDGDARLGIALMDFPAKAAFGADQAGSETVSRGAGSIRRLGDSRIAFGRATARSFPPVAAPTLTHSPGLLSPPGGEWRAV